MFSLSDIKLLHLFTTKQNDPDVIQAFIDKSSYKDDDLVSNQEAIECVQKEYFDADITFDINRCELNKLPTLCNSKDIILHCKYLTRQHQIVSKKLLLLILQKHLKYQKELDAILKIKRHISDTLNTCKHSREDLILATAELTTSSLKIIYYFRRKIILTNLLEILDTIKTLNISEGDLTEDSDDEIPEELKLDYVDEMGTVKLSKKEKYTGPIITNTSLSLLRICGRYLQVTRFFHDNNIKVIHYITQIFEMYFYTVYTFFTIDHQNYETSPPLSTNIKRIISRIKDTLFFDYNKVDENLHMSCKVQSPYFSDTVDLNDSNTLFGLAERIVAIESLVFLGIQYETFQKYLYSVLYTDEERMYSNNFYNNTVSLAVLLRKPIYMATIYKFFDLSNIFNMMGRVNWELKDVVSQHNTYIDFLIEELHKFEAKLKDIYNLVFIQKEVYEAIWENVAHFITHTIVEGFSNAKKCTNGGRALMQLDFIQLVSKYETISLVRPMPYQEYVTNYIKAYYLPESNLESWIKDHPEYSSKHLIGLVSSMYQNKKIRHKFISFIDDQRLNR